MFQKFVLLFALVLLATGVQSQMNHEVRPGARMKGFGFITGPGNFNRSAETCGIYQTPDDRRAGTLSTEIDCRSEAHRIKSGFLRDKSAIKIVRDEMTQRYLRSDLYGYRDCKGNEYHFFDGKTYELVNPGEPIPLYRIFEWRGKQRVARHFFGNESRHIVLPLTFENLRAEFSEESQFLEKLDALAKNDFQLVKFRYAINRVRLNVFEETGSGAL